MAGFFNRLKAAGTGTSGAGGNASANKKKEEAEPEPTPLERMLQNAGPLREDGSDKFFGLENFGNTCYCNSIVQALFYSETFRENVVNYPPLSPSDTPNGKRAKINVQIRPPMNGNAESPAQANKKGLSAAQAMKQRQALNGGSPLGGPGQPGIRPEDKPDSPEYKKKQAMLKGPVLELAQENSAAYGMEESTFTGLKDLFTALIESTSRTGVLSPQRFLEIFKRDNEMFRNSMHQDAHEFYGLVLNDVIANVEANAKRIQERETLSRSAGVTTTFNGSTVGAKTQSAGPRPPGTGWVHDIFEGLLTSETKCLTCETASQRDETFLDLSIDLEEHSSVTSCLGKFSAEEMLCERNKFHCDRCGGLQEAEKRMKIKRLPKVLALHLKRFQYTEDYSRLQKLFHRVVYPYHLRMFNTTDDAEEPDRIYELYAVVVHIGGHAYHGHYVSVIKTADRGWLLFDDEMVEPVDKHFVRNFFGDKPGMACAYVLFYQETTFEKMAAEQEAEGLEEIKLATQTADLDLDQASNGVHVNSASPLLKHTTTPVSPVEDHDALAALDHALTASGGVNGGPSPVQPLVPTTSVPTHPLVVAPPPPPPPPPGAVAATSSKAYPSGAKPSKKEKKEQKAQEKARKAAEKEQAKMDERQRKEREARLKEARKTELEDTRKALHASKQTAAEEEVRHKKETAVNSKDAGTGNSNGGSGFLNRSKTVGAKTMSRRSFAFLNKEKDAREKAPPADTAEGSSDHITNGTPSSPHPDGYGKLKERFSFGIGRKKSSTFLS